MIYVALLRGINVGGNTKIAMSELKTVFESLEFENVTTYINSGNVIFTTQNDPRTLDALIENAIKEAFQLSVPVVVKEKDSILSITKSVSLEFTNDSEQKTDVLFLWKEVDSKNTLKQLLIKPKIDTVTYRKGAIIWNVKRKDVTKSGLLKIVGTPLYKQVTVRNINTVRKLAQLMESISL